MLVRKVMSINQSFGESGRSNSSVGFQNTIAFSRNTKADDDRKPTATSTSSKFNHSDRGISFYCKKPVHIVSNCPWLHAKRQQKDAAVQLVSTLS